MLSTAAYSKVNTSMQLNKNLTNVYTHVSVLETQQHLQNLCFCHSQSVPISGQMAS